MRTFLIYLQMECKRTLKSIPYVLTGAIVLVLLAGAIAFSAGKLLYGDRAVGRIKVGVVMPEDDALAGMAMRMVSSLDSVKSLCDFTYVEAAQGRRQLKDGELLALLEIPDGLVEGIMDGSNVPVTVVLPDNAGLEAAVFKELTGAGSSLLKTAQAGIYAADDYLNAYGMTVFIAQAERDLNEVFLRCALARERCFSAEEASAAGDVGVAAYYGISAAVGVLLLLGIPAACIAGPYRPATEEMLLRIGIGRAQRTAARTLSLCLLFLLFFSVPAAVAAYRGLFKAEAAAPLMGLLLCLAAAGWIHLHYELCRNETAAILLLFGTTVVMLFMSGGIIPSVFLPKAVQAAGKWMPAAYFADGIRFMITGEANGSAAKLVLLEAAAFFLSSGLRRERD